MTQPKFAPITQSDEIRPAASLEVPRAWVPHRPGEHVHGAAAAVRAGASAGPDQGYALSLAARLSDRVVLAPGEHEDDALALAVVVALRRAARFGRAPVVTDIEVALGALGYLDPPPAAADERRRRVGGCSHDGWQLLEVAALVPDALIAGSVAGARESAIDWAGVPTP